MGTQTAHRSTPASPVSADRGPFAWLGRVVYRRRRLILAGTALFMVAAAVAGLSVFDRLSGGGFDDPAAESVRAAEIMDQRFDAGAPDLVVLVDPEGPTLIEQGAAATAGRALQRDLEAEDGVQQVLSYWSTGNPALRSEDGTQGLMLVRITGDDDASEAVAERLIPLYEDGVAGLDLRFGGAATTNLEFGTTIGEDLARAEAIAIPISLVLLLIVFGSLVAALLPMLVAGMAIVGTFLALFVISLFTDVSVFSINLTTALGLGLAIDYSLFIVSRFREELGAGSGTEQALARTMQTAGRTVAFSALTVAVSLAALLVFPLYFLRSFGYAGIAVVLIAAAGALLSLPALLAVLGPRVNRFAIRRSVRGPAVEGGFWTRLAATVMRRPVLVGAPVALLLAALAAPFLGVAWGLPDDRSLPPGNDVRVVADTLRNDFSGGATTATSVVLPQASTDQAGQVASAISQLDGVLGVEAVAGSYADGRQVTPPTPASARFADEQGSYLTVSSDVEPLSDRGSALVQEIRAVDSPVEMLVTGRAADLLDSKTAIFDLVPLALAIIAATTFVLLFLMTGSVLVPVKAIVLNVLSLGATFGAMVWIFQDGNGADLLNFTPTGFLDTSMPILMFCVAFGLSMDYEVFLLSRIKEAHDLTGDTRLAVATGLQRTGRIMTAAAAILAVTFIAFSTSGVTFIKMMGIGLTLAVLLDATLVRGLLVPAFMRLAGEANWWAPGPLRRVYRRFALAEA